MIFSLHPLYATTQIGFLEEICMKYLPVLGTQSSVYRLFANSLYKSQEFLPSLYMTDSMFISFLLAFTIWVCDSHHPWPKLGGTRLDRFPWPQTPWIPGSWCCQNLFLLESGNRIHWGQRSVPLTGFQRCFCLRQRARWQPLPILCMKVNRISVLVIFLYYKVW